MAAAGDVPLPPPADLASLGAQLHAAVRRNDAATARTLLKAHPRTPLVDALDADGCTPLIAALSRGKRDGNVSALEVLVSFRANLNAKTKAGMTACIFAAMFNHIESLRVLLTQRPPPDIDAQDVEGMTCTMHAAFAAHIDIVRLISTLCKPNLSLKSKNGMTAVQCAKNDEIRHILGSINGPLLVASAARGDVTTIAALLEQETWLDFQEEGTLRTALIAATQTCQTQAVRLLVTQLDKPCPRLFVLDAAGRTALSYASEGGFEQIVRLLLAVPVRRQHELDRIGGGMPALNGAAIAACMKSACRTVFDWKTWRSCCASCGLILCTRCASQTALVREQRSTVCRACCEAIEAAAAAPPAPPPRAVVSAAASAAALPAIGKRK